MVDLLEEYSFEPGVTIEDVFLEHNKVGELLIVLDGSEKNHSMSFGWTISNPRSGKVLVACCGPAAGQGSSLQAEGFSILAALKFIELALLFTKQTELVKLEAVADNEKLI